MITILVVSCKNKRQRQNWLKNNLLNRSPFTRSARRNTNKYKPSIPETDISFVSSGRPSTERTFPAFYENVEPVMNPGLSPRFSPRFSNISEPDDRRSVSTSSFTRKSLDYHSPWESSSSSLESGRSSCSTQYNVRTQQTQKGHLGFR